jgi:phosphate-selective porin OprO/OprP
MNNPNLTRGACFPLASLLGAVFLLFTAGNGATWAQENSFDSAHILQRLEQQDAELQRLRSLLEQAPTRHLPPVESEDEYPVYLNLAGEAEKKESKPAEQKKESKPSEKKESKPEPEWVDTSNEKWNVKLGGHVQLDYVNWAKADPAIAGTQDFFEFRRLRLVADGTGYGTYDFRLQMTLEPETVGETVGVLSPDVKDAYFSINELPFLGRFRIGNFFVPFGLEQVTNDTNNVFVERSIPSQGIFTPDREVGIASYHVSEDQNFTWSGGAFFDSISEGLKERIDDNQGYRLSGRVTWLPYYDEASNGRYLIHTGLGVLYTADQDSRVRFRARPQIHEGPRLIDSGVIAADDYTTGNAEFAAVMGRLTLQSETYVSQVNLTNGSTNTVNGTYLHASYFLTGENRIYERFGQHGAQFGRNQPFNNVFAIPGARSWGAWEAKTRWSHLDLNDLGRGQYNDFTCGMNWYWSDRVRVMFDWIHPITSSTTNFGSTQSDILATRFDWNW